MVSMSARIWVGWNSSVSPFQTGTPANCASVSTTVLVEAPVLDAVIQPPEHPRGVLDRLLVAHLRRLRVEIGHVRALVVGGDLEGAAGAGGGLLEDEADLLAPELLDLEAALLGGLEARRRGR